MPRYHRLGQLPAQRHIQFRQPDGSLYAEQLFSTHGFSGPMALMYHIKLPPSTEDGMRLRGNC